MLSLVFDTNSSKLVYVDPPISFFKKITGAVIIVMSALITFAVSIILNIFAGAMGNWLGGLINPTLGSVLAFIFLLIALYYSFISSIIFVAYIVLFARKRIFKTLGYFKNGYFDEKDSRMLEFCNMDGVVIQTIDLSVYSVLVSRKINDGMELLVQSGEGNTINLVDIFNSQYHLFNPRSAQPGKGVRRDNRSMQTYPADEMFAQWNKMKLVKDGVETQVEQPYLF